MILKALQQAKEADALVEIYANGSKRESHCIGYVDALDQEKVRLRLVDASGADAGILEKRWADIYLLEQDTAALNLIEGRREGLA